MKLNASARLLATEDKPDGQDATWWESMDKDSQREYVKKHPTSEYAPGHGPAVKPENKVVNTPINHEKKPVNRPIKNKPKKPINKPKPKVTDKDGFLKNVFQKGKDKVGDLLEKGKHGFVHRLIDPLGLTKEGKPTKKKSTKKIQTKPKDSANRGGEAGPTEEKKGVKHLMSPAYKESGKKGISPFGYWKDKNTWVSETEEEWDKSLTPKEKKHFGR